MNKVLIGIGVALILAGILWPLLVKSGIGRLPGDIAIERGNTRVYFPIVSSIVVSILLSVILTLAVRFFGRR